MRVLVAGEGATAHATVDALLEEGCLVRLLSARAQEMASRWPHDVEPWVAAASSRSPAGAAEGCAAVLDLAAVRSPGAGAIDEGGAPTFRARIDVRGTRGLLAEAERARVPRFVLLSSLRYARGESDEGRSLRQVEDLVRGFRGVWSILRAGLVYGPGTGPIAALATMIRTLPAVPLVDRGRGELQPLWHRDLGRALARATRAPEAASRLLHAAGPERVRLSEVVDRLCGLIGRRPLFVPVPAVVALLGAEASTILGLRVPAHALALAELDGASLLSPAVENALTSVLGIEPTLLDRGLAALVADVPEQAPASAAPIHRRELHVLIEGSSQTARGLRDLFRRRAAHVLALADGPPEGQMIKTGTLLSAPVPLRGLVALRVAEVAPDHLTAITVEGDPLAGMVTLRFTDEQGRLRVEAIVETAAASALDRVIETATAGALGGTLADLDWQGALERLVAISGGRAPKGVQRQVRTLDGKEARAVAERAERLRRARQRATAPSPTRRPPTRALGTPRAARRRPPADPA